MHILVVEDHPTVRLGLVRLVERAFPLANVAESDSLASARIRIAAKCPDAITLDLGLPDASGIDALVDLQLAAPGIPIVVVSFGSEAIHAQRVMQHGAAGYVDKDRAVEDLVEALTRVV